MDISNFIKLGFNKNEAKVYQSLIKFETADASRLIKDTKFHKNIVYDNLEKLIDKGLVNFVIEGGKKVFSVAPPEILLHSFEEQERELFEKKELAKKVSKEIKLQIKEVPENQEAVVSRGMRAIKSFYDNALGNGDYFVIGVPRDSIEIMGKDFWMNHNIKRQKKKIGVRMIFNSSARYHGEASENKYTQIKYFDKDFEPLTEIHIQKDIVAIIVWTREPLIFRINNKTVADSYMEYFNSMWKVAKK